MKTEKSKIERRNRAIRNLYIKHGASSSFIARTYNLSRERVRQILSQFPEYRKYREKYGRNTIRKRKPYKYTCSLCGIPSESNINKKGRHTFCSFACFLKWRKKGIDRHTTEKRCSQCGELKPINEFYKKKKGNWKRYSHCKKCHKLFCYFWKERNPERAKEINDRANKKYLSFKKNREKVARTWKIYYWKNRERILQQMREYNARKKRN